MALEKVIIQYDAEIKALETKLATVEAKLKGVETAGKKATDGLKSGVEGVDKQVNTFGKDTLNNIKGMIIGAFAVDRVIAFGKESVKAFAEAELNAKKLGTALKNISGEGTGALDRLIKQSEKLQKISIFSDDNIQRAQTQLIQFGLTSDQVESLIPKVLDLASATGTDLGQATDVLIQGINGVTRGLKPLGIDFDATGSKEKNLSIITDQLNKYYGQTESVLQTTSGEMANFTNRFDDLQEVVGEFIVLLGKGLATDFLSIFDPDTYNGNASAMRDYAKRLEEIKGIAEKTASESTIPQLNAQLMSNQKFIKQALAEIAKVKDEDTRKTLNTEIQLAKEQSKIIKEVLAEKEFAALKERDIKTLTTEELKRLNTVQAQDEEERRRKVTEDIKKANEQRQQDLEKEVAEKQKKNADLSFQEMGEDIDRRFDKVKEGEKQQFEEIKEKNKKEVALRESANAQFFAAEKRKTEAVEKAERDRLEIQQASVNAGADLLSGLVDIFNEKSQMRSDLELQNIDLETQRKLEALDIEQDKREGIFKEKTSLEKEFDAKRQAIEDQAAQKQKLIRTEQAKKDKEAALIQAAINTAVAVTAGLAKPAVPPFPSAIAAGIFGGVQLALIAAQPIPQFAKGVIGFKGKGTGTSDDNLVRISNQESIITAEKTKKYKEELTAMHNNKFDSYVLKNYITPALKKAKLKEQSFSNMSESMSLNFDDYRIVKGLKPLKKIATSQDINRLINAMKPNYR